MKKERAKQVIQYGPDEDTMRPEYDFTHAKKGTTAVRYARGSNVVVIEPDVVNMFPNAAAVNETLRALGGIIQKVPRPKSRKPLSANP